MKKVRMIIGYVLLYIVGIFLLILNIEALDRFEWTWSEDIVILSVQYTLNAMWWCTSIAYFFLALMWPFRFLVTEEKKEPLSADSIATDAEITAYRVAAREEKNKKYSIENQIHPPQ